MRARKKNVLRSIRGSMNRFLSILFIVALGAGFLAGLFAASPDMYETADDYMDENRLFDIDIKSPLGFTPEDLEAVAAVDGVETVQAAHVADMVLELAGADRVTCTARVLGVLSADGFGELNRFSLTEGRMPETAEECVIQVVAGRYSDGSLHVGDTVTISPENATYDTLCGDVISPSLTVVGFCESPMSIGVEADATTVGSGSLSHMVFVRGDYFTSETYSDIYLTLRSAAEMDTFGEEYLSLVESVTADLETLGVGRLALRTEELRAQAEDGLEQLQQTVSLLETIVRTEQTMAMDAAAQAVQTAALAARIAGSEQPGAQTLAGLLGRVATSCEERLSGMGEGDSIPEPALLTQARDSLAEVEEALASLDRAVWLTRTREDSAGFASYKSNVGKVAALSKVFPVFFFVVALLVALTTMTRLIEENRTQIGTLKAIGFSDGQILSEYLLYSFVSSLLGCALGFGVGFWLFPKAISSAYGMLYFLPGTKTPFRLEIALWVAPVTIGSILLATLWAAWTEFRACPAALMVPKAPSAGKRIWLERIPFIWKHMSFTHKVTARNLFRYKKRFIMTVVGVAGCSALLVTGFGLRDSINDIVDKQYGEINKYELSILTDNEKAVTADDTLRAFLEDDSQIAAWTTYAGESGKVIAADGSGKVNICVPGDKDAFPDFVTLRERRGGKGLTLDGQGVILTEKLCETLGVSAGDTVTLENADGLRAQVAVSGITENYLTSYAYLTKEAYAAAFGEEPAQTMVVCRVAKGADTESLTARALAGSSVLYARSALSLKASFADSIRSINAVVLVLILAAGLLCMVVLYNLTNVNICERRRELATIRVLGFHERETEQYIFRETNTLSFLGALLGLGLGVWLHSFVVRTVEVDSVMFGRTIYPRSYLFALLITVVFTLLVNRIMSRQIRRVDMVEAMKAND